MIKRINLIILTFILLVILLVVEVAIVKSASDYEPRVNVVYAKTSISEDTVIRESMLEERKVGISTAHKKSLNNLKDVVGKKARIDIEEGEMLLEPKLMSGSEMEEIKVEDRNNRLYSVEFKGDQANGWWLKADQRVDIIYVPGEKQREDVSVQSDNANNVQKLRGIRIAALIDEKGRLLKNGERTSVPKYISFEVTDRQCEFLAYAKGNGRLEIAVIPAE
jgi:Flp pilus assembly protein CpaB